MIYNDMLNALTNRDVDTFLALIHDDFVMVSHQTGENRTKVDFATMMRAMMASDALQINGQRCLYENDDVLIEHSFMSFPDASKEAVMAVWMKKDGKLISIETGATPVK